MIQLLFTVVFGQMLLIVALLFKTPLRKLLIIAMDRAKRGRGPIVISSIGATLLVVLLSSLSGMSEIKKRVDEGGQLNPTDEVLFGKNMLESTLLGFVLFLSLMIDRLHHYIRELRLLRKTLEAAKKQSRSFEDGKNGSAEEQKALTEEIATLKAKTKKLESQCEAEGSKAKALEGEVEALKKQSEGFLMEYDRLLADNQNLRSQLEAVDQNPVHLDNKKAI